jgi:uncharacterized OB-fold protein
MYQDSRSVHLSAPADDVWRLVRDFEHLDAWMPGIDALTVDWGGCDSSLTRHVTAGGQVFVERHVATDDEHRSVWYTLLEPALPVRGHMAVISVTPNGPRNCAVTWTVSFSVPGSNAADGPSRDAIARDVLDNMLAAFDYGLGALGEKFGIVEPETIPVWDRYPDLPMDEDDVARYEGWALRRVLMPFCESCETWHAVFRGSCPRCGSGEVVPREVAGTGVVHNAMRLHVGPANPWVRYPIWVVTAQLDEQDNLRQTGLLVGPQPDVAPLGALLTTVFIDRGGVPQPAYTLADPYGASQ